jgi:hypothetical protein
VEVWKWDTTIEWGIVGKDSDGNTKGDEKTYAHRRRGSRKEEVLGLILGKKEAEGVGTGPPGYGEGVPREGEAG